AQIFILAPIVLRHMHVSAAVHHALGGTGAARVARARIPMTADRQEHSRRDENTAHGAPVHFRASPSLLRKGLGSRIAAGSMTEVDIELRPRLVFLAVRNATVPTFLLGS